MRQIDFLLSELKASHRVAKIRAEALQQAIDRIAKLHRINDRLRDDVSRLKRLAK